MDETRIGVILIMGLMAYGLRALPHIFTAAARRFPESCDRLLRFISYALICSIIAITLFMSGARFEVESAPHRVLALSLAVIVARRTRSAAAGMLTGTVLVTVLSWLI